MRVLHVTDTFLPKIGGAEIAIDQLARAMGELGVKCAVLAQEVRGMGREIETPYPLRRYRNPRSSKWAGWWIARHIAKMERELGAFDALIGHHAFPPGYACVKYSRRTGRTAVVYPRGGDIYEVSRFRKKRGAWRKLSWALADATRVVCASGAMEGLVKKIIGISAAEGRICMIPNGVNLEELRGDARESRFENDEQLRGPFVLGLGRTIRRKGFHLLIDAFAQMDAPGWKLVIAGDGRELEALRAQGAKLGERVYFTGLVRDADKRWLLQRCQFMAAPSLEESFGNVALEAMACGKPVIASKASGFTEIVCDGVNGRLVDVNSVERLAEALADYVHRPLDGERLAARECAEGFSWPRVAQQYIKLLEGICGL